MAKRRDTSNELPRERVFEALCSPPPGGGRGRGGGEGSRIAVEDSVASLAAQQARYPRSRRAITPPPAPSPSRGGGL
jgi:hypothetical protein